MDPMLLTSALWGLAGAFMYAAPKLSTCAFTCKITGGTPAQCLVDATIALTVGAVASAAFGGWAQIAVKHGGPSELRAIAAVIGLLANPVAPRLTGRLANWVIKKVPDP